MSALYFLIPVSLLVAVVFLGWFIWAVRSGQYEDTSTPALRMLADEEAEPGAAPRVTDPTPKQEKRE
ncbi:MAG: cbb3-type cytochrome oxidase assembly protein CcoS [Verrucomicrobia bacterium]|nr:MAG: cbb3-type cytochrome oxidase assembly protein CcoS [Verrucomicrobiota bacterium]